jgi:hypothetical protein
MLVHLRHQFQSLVFRFAVRIRIRQLLPRGDGPEFGDGGVGIAVDQYAIAMSTRTPVSARPHWRADQRINARALFRVAGRKSEQHIPKSCCSTAA